MATQEDRANYCSFCIKYIEDLVSAGEKIEKGCYKGGFKQYNWTISKMLEENERVAKKSPDILKNIYGSGLCNECISRGHPSPYYRNRLKELHKKGKSLRKFMRFLSDENMENFVTNLEKSNGEQEISIIRLPVIERPEEKGYLN